MGYKGRGRRIYKCGPGGPSLIFPVQRCPSIGVTMDSDQEKCPEETEQIAF